MTLGGVESIIKSFDATGIDWFHNASEAEIIIFAVVESTYGSINE